MNSAPAYAFPTDLVTAIRTRWEVDSEGRFELPDGPRLLNLLETCYHVSLRTSERRPVRCVLAYAHAADVLEGALELGIRSVPLSESELVRLSPITQHRQTVLGCDENRGELRIWGFFEHGHSWVQHSAGDPPGVSLQPEDDPPNCLMVSIDDPGALTISQGRTRLVQLRDGRIVLPRQNPSRTVETRLGCFFDQVVGDLRQSTLCTHLDDDVATHGSTESHRGAPSLLGTYTRTVAAILERIRDRQHGGSVVITRAPLDERHAQVTYDVANHAGLARKIVAYHTVDCRLRRYELATEAVSELRRVRSELELRHASRQLIRGVGQISLLAAVDGAVLLDEQLSVLGFGVRFPVMASPGTTVTDGLTGVVRGCDEWGTRHQSIFSICRLSEQALGLIVSQDGEVRAVKSEDGTLHCWTGILE